jgi:hypothetical protein
MRLDNIGTENSDTDTWGIDAPTLSFSVSYSSPDYDWDQTITWSVIFECPGSPFFLALQIGLTDCGYKKVV